jgi:hypothetical protein
MQCGARAGRAFRAQGGDRDSKLPDGKAGPGDTGSTHKQVHEVRQVRDAERAEPGIVRRTTADKGDASLLQICTCAMTIYSKLSGKG